MTDFVIGFAFPFLVLCIVVAAVVTVIVISMGMAALLDKLAAYIMKRWWKHGKR